MKLNPYKLISFQIEKDGMLKARVPDVIKEKVNIEIDDYQVIITIK